MAVTYRDGLPAHPSTNRAWYRVTSLMCPTTLPLPALRGENGFRKLRTCKGIVAAMCNIPEDILIKRRKQVSENWLTDWKFFTGTFAVYRTWSKKAVIYLSNELFVKSCNFLNCWNKNKIRTYCISVRYCICCPLTNQLCVGEMQISVQPPCKPVFEYTHRLNNKLF